MRTFYRAISLFIIFLLVIPLPALSRDTGDAAPSPAFTKEQLAQMLAPIALYPDSLLSQVLMASTYPLEVIEADRWVRKNPDLTGNSLDEALKDRDWDASVQSLCYFPSVLASMSEKIAQTAKLGDAFLAQPDDVMDTIQELRRKAQIQGNLSSSPEQKVVAENGTISIEPVNPEIIYVPAYDPLSVYGPWFYPAYPPYFWDPGPVIVGGGISFWSGFFVGIGIGSWCYFDWHHHHIFIDFHRRHRFHRGDDERRERDQWRHDSRHRRGVAYRDKTTARKFGQSPAQSREARRDFRGFPDRRGRDNQTRETLRKDIGKGRPARVNNGVTDRRDRVRAGGRDARRVYDRGERGRDSGRDNAFSRINDGKEERMSSERGRASRESLNSGSRSSNTPLRDNRDGRSDRRQMGR